MSAPTGIAVSQELSSTFADAVESKDVRFLKVSIRNESLVPDGTTPPSGTLEADLDNLGSILDDNAPAYVLVRLDDPPSEWLAVYYVPDTAQVRDKMLYAATRNTLTKSLGSAHFTDQIFATTKDDLTANAYAKHKQHLAAPKPMSAREKEMEAVKAAERSGNYEGSRARATHVPQTVGLKWSEEVENAVKNLGSGDGGYLVLVTIDTATETLQLSSEAECNVDDLGSALPVSDPAYAFFAWPQEITSPPRRDIVFIYSCPSSSPIKHRMLYSSGCAVLVNQAKEILAASGSESKVASRRVETSDPSELDGSFLALSLGLTDGAEAGNPRAAAPTAAGEKAAFARPKGPGRRRP
ncbi:actin depolymerizing protein [Wolfiporia cocos MD-104 SS10]|uniref:Actin depolymerizing protein n=1 Tax=Wolfiporia cocos (strain MD-104) TaxID=742152 RepID=A0A2H3JK87_WOLCO|nr:actin depolymerizing protein [Wolfiporia cocos MD-104 SS10]